jgi:hypothetical protein
LDFSFEIHFESEEVSMEKVVHLFEIFTTTFFQIFESREGQFWTGQSLKEFEFSNSNKIDRFGKIQTPALWPGPAC